MRRLVHQEIYYEIGDGNEHNRFFHETIGIKNLVPIKKQKKLFKI